MAASILEKEFKYLSFPCIHIAMLSWRYNIFNLDLEEP